MIVNLELKGLDEQDGSVQQGKIRSSLDSKISVLEKRVKAFAADDVFLRVLVDETSAHESYHVSITFDVPGKTLAVKEQASNLASAISAAFAEIERQFDAYRASMRGEHEWSGLQGARSFDTVRLGRRCLKAIMFSLDEQQSLRAFGLLLLIVVAWSAGAQGRRDRDAAIARQNSNPSTAPQIRIPNRPEKPLFQGQQGKQKTEIHFDPATGMVTLKLLVQDPSGYFISNIRRDNFVVYENGLRQQNTSVEIEHAPVSLALLMEYGGRYPALNRAVCQEVSRAAHQVLDVLGPDDKLAIWTYGDAIKQLSDFSTDHKALDNLFFSLQPPGLSEINLYDALVSMSQRMREVTGRKAIILISSGIDTFSKASYNDALKAIQHSNTPIYVISMLPILEEAIQVHGSEDALRGIDRKRLESQLMEIARVSGGRFYSPGNTIDLSGTYDDIMENLKVRYVITYKSSTHTDSNSPRTVRVELLNPDTGGPLQIVDANGRTVPAKVIVQGSYTPSTASRT